MTTEEKVNEINNTIRAEIAKLNIQLPLDADKLWKLDIRGIAVRRYQMDDNLKYIDLSTKTWNVAQDGVYDFQLFHVRKIGYNNHPFTTEKTNRVGFDMQMEMVVLSNKKMAFPLVFEAIGKIGRIKVNSLEEDYEMVTSEYFVRDKAFGVNPDYRGLLINYTINVIDNVVNYDIID
jgi:hypothetical protein